MNTLERGLDENLGRPAWVAVGLSILRGLGYVLRVMIFAPLAVLEPVVTRLLSAGCLLGLLCWVVFKLEDPTGAHHLHYGLLFYFSIGCAAALILYHLLMRALAP